MSLTETIESLRPRVEPIAAQCAAASARLIAVVKRQPPERIKAAYALGVRDFAHSYVQEALDQQDLWAHMPEARWHFIGRIQSNKTRHLCEGWHRIHSVDRLKTARRLGSASVLVQVRLGGEHSKAGVDPAELRETIERIAAETSVQIRGLMALPPPRARWGDLRPFETLARLRDELQATNHLMPDAGELSMGTSGDYVEALGAGATWVRIGSALLGARQETT